MFAAMRALVETHGPDVFSVAQAARRAGVTSAAPYEHFKDRQEIPCGVVSEAMDHLQTAKKSAAAAHPTGSLEAVAAIGLAYVDFARVGSGVFRLVFGLTEGHENAPDRQQKGASCLGVVVQAVGDRLGRPLEDPDVQRRAYMLWSFVHGHSFLHIDMKTNVTTAEIDDWLYLTEISGAVLGLAAPT
ncbi:MAG: TetR/AcrR family transcriptional regulator [Rhodobacteraceae bacterium]|nr:MAG: TetR/AcrR family transcriptional regulator [Paracoccaceae bacterium]